MRHILASMVLVVLLFPSLALGETVRYEDLAETDGLYYKKFSDVPFTGKVIGKTQETFVSFKDGKKDGPSVTFWDNGRIAQKGTYKDGEYDGLWIEVYETGQLYSKGTYKDGREDGPSILYNKHGQVEYREM